MRFTAASSLEKRKGGQLLAIPFWKGDKKAVPATSLAALSPMVVHAIDCGDFKGEEEELLLLYPDHLPEKRLLLVGLGEKSEISTEQLRRCYGKVANFSREKRLTHLQLLFPKLPALPQKGVAGVVEGLLLANYLFTHAKDADKKPSLLEEVSFVGLTSSDLTIAERSCKSFEGLYLARDLVNGNADLVTTEELVRVAKGLAKRFPEVKATIFDQARLEKEKMGLLLAVGRGSSYPPFLISLQYRGNPKSADHTVIVGKGVTFDTGGINLKPTGSIEDMRSDMGGAAAALGTLLAVASLGLKVNVTVLVPTVENAIGPKSYKPGDVYVGYNGKSVEIGNTDAEGRLILADALAYAAARLKPTRMIDLATLTGAIVIALGEEVTGLMSNDDQLAKELIEAGEETFERVWRMPLFEEYQTQLKSEIADIKSTGGRPAGSITAARFLQQFVDATPWAHLDIAGTAFLEKPRRYHPRFATGAGVRLLVAFLEKLA